MKEKKQKRKMKLWKKIIILILIAMIAYGIWFFYRSKKNGGGFSGMLATVVGHDENTRKNLPEFRVLLLGVSTDLGDNAPTDTIMVASYNPNTQKATLLSIPRDTYVGSNQNKATPSDKINSLYSISIDKILDAVNNLTGLDIQYYAVVKTEAFIKLVDAIGGVTFNVPMNMKYDDPTQNLHIDLKEGEQILDGDKAEQLLRFRHGNWDPVTRSYPTYPEEYGNNDTGRMRTQREFIMTVMQQTLKPGNIFKIGEILDIASKNLETNLDFNYLKDYIPYAVEFSTENMTTDTLPGVNDQLPPESVNTKNRYWFFLPNKTETKALIQELFFPKTTEEGADTQNQTENEISSTTTKKQVTLEVLNGTGDDKKLEQAVNRLKANGYQVTKTGKTSEISKTIITNKKELPEETLKNIQEILENASIGNNKNLSSKVDATIVIGKDFNQDE